MLENLLVRQPTWQSVYWRGNVLAWLADQQDADVHPQAPNPSSRHAVPPCQSFHYNAGEGPVSMVGIERGTIGRGPVRSMLRTRHGVDSQHGSTHPVGSERHGLGQVEVIGLPRRQRPCSRRCPSRPAHTNQRRCLRRRPNAPAWPD